MSQDLGNLPDTDFSRLTNIVCEIVGISHGMARNGDPRAHEIYALARDARDLLLLDEVSRETLRRLTGNDRPSVYGVVISREVEDYVKTRQNINAIKLLRTETGLGLKEAKDIVEAYANTIRPNF